MDEGGSETTEWLADASISEGGSMNFPVEARRHLGIDGVAATVLVFKQPGRVILTPVGLADELMEFAAERVEARKAEPESATEG